MLLKMVFIDFLQLLNLRRKDEESVSLFYMFARRLALWCYWNCIYIYIYILPFKYGRICFKFIGLVLFK